MKTLIKSGWETVRFGDVVRNVNASERDPLGAGIERYVGLEHIEPENLHIKSWGLVEDGITFTKKFVKGQVLFGKRRAYQKKVAVAEFDGICSGDILVFESNGKDLIPELLPFIVQSDSFFNYALDTSAGSLSPRTSWKMLKEYEFPLPPKDEQRRIAEILWSADGVNDSYKKSEIDAYVLFRRLLDKHLFSPKLIKDKSVVTPLNRLIDIKHGYAFKSKYFTQENENYPILLTPGNFSLGGGLFFTKSNTKYYTDDVQKDFILKTDDLVVVMTDLTPDAKLLCSPAFVDSDFKLLHNQRIGKIVIKDDLRITKDYLFFTFLSTYFHTTIKNTASGSTVRHTSPKLITSVDIVLPSIEEQERISSLLRESMKKISDLKEHICTLKTSAHAIRENML